MINIKLGVLPDFYTYRPYCQQQDAIHTHHNTCTCHIFQTTLCTENSWKNILIMPQTSGSPTHHSDTNPRLADRLEPLSRRPSFVPGYRLFIFPISMNFPLRKASFHYALSLPHTTAAVRHYTWRINLTCGSRHMIHHVIKCHWKRHS
jgi:hypothetical protein